MADDIAAFRAEIAEMRRHLAASDKDGALARLDRKQIRKSLDRIEHIVDGEDNPTALRTEVPRAHSRLDAADRERKNMLERMNASKLAEATKALMGVLRFGDAAKRGWLLFAVAAVLMVCAAGYGVYTFFSDPEERAHRRALEVEASRREWVRDSLEAVRRIEEARGDVEITVGEGGQVSTEAVDADAVDLDADTVIGPNLPPPEAPPE